MRRFAKTDVLAGLVFATVGLAGLWVGRSLNVGSAGEMGEGYFPLLMCWFLVGLGAIIAIGGWLRAGEAIAAIAWRPVGFVTAAVLGFALVLESLGVVAAVIAAVVLANHAGEPMRARGVTVLALVLAIAVLAIFVWGLGLPLRALPRSPW
ncbi:MAG: tripartite tricarboxylate transporter TctB family protein [Burkholderiales bacterium]